jgi:hypothetical protein
MTWTQTRSAQINADEDEVIRENPRLHLPLRAAQGSVSHFLRVEQLHLDFESWNLNLF